MRTVDSWPKRLRKWTFFGSTNFVDLMEIAPEIRHRSNETEPSCHSSAKKVKWTSDANRDTARKTGAVRSSLRNQSGATFPGASPRRSTGTANVSNRWWESSNALSASLCADRKQLKLPLHHCNRRGLHLHQIRPFGLATAVQVPTVSITRYRGRSSFIRRGKLDNRSLHSIAGREPCRRDRVRRQRNRHLPKTRYHPSIQYDDR